MPEGAPEAEEIGYIDDVAAYLRDKDADAVIKQLQAQHSRFSMLESRLLQQRTRLQVKLPELKKALDMVTLLLEKQGTGEAVNVNFALVDNVFAKAVLQDTKVVSLWLGANVMLEYPIEEAHGLLKRNHASALASVEVLKRDMLGLRDKITTAEVSIARVYNETVKQRRGSSAAQ